MNAQLSNVSGEKLRSISNTLTPVLSSYYLVLFLWLLSVYSCAVGSANLFTPQKMNFFVVANTLILSVAAIAVSLAARSLRLLSTINFVAFSLVVTSTATALSPVTDERLTLVNLFFVLIIAIPALSDMWSWPVQAVAGILAIIAAVVMWLPVGGWSATNSILSVVVSAILSTTVSFIHFPKKNSEKSKQEREQRELLSAVAAERFGSKTSGMLLLQANLLLVLFFFDSLASDIPAALVATPFVYALMLFVFEMLMLSIVQRKYLPATVIAFTVAIAAVVLVMQSPENENPLRRVLPVIYLAWSTAILPWSLVQQITVAWLLVVLGVVASVFPLHNADLSWTVMLFERFNYSGQELALLICGIGTSVLMARVMQDRMFTRFSQYIDEGREISNAPEELSHAPVKSLHSSAKGIFNIRIQHLVYGLVFLGVACCAVSTLAVVMYGKPSFWQIVTPWSGFCLLWAVLLYSVRRQQGLDKVWFYGVTVALVALVYTAIVLLRYDVTPSFWVLWPFCVLLTISLIPWGAIELCTLIVIASLISIEILSGVKSTALVPIHVGTIILGTLFSLRVSRYLKERHLLFNYPVALSRAENEDDVLHVLADYLSSLFDSSFALVMKSSQQPQLVINGEVYPINSATQLVPKFEQFLSINASSSREVQAQILNWLPMTVELFDRRVGMHSAHHGTAILLYHAAIARLHENLGSETSLPIPPSGTTFPLVIFLGARLPQFSHFRRMEIEIAKALGDAALLRSETFEERKQHSLEIKQYQSTQTEREYELGTLVHDINNTVQDLTLLCEMMLEDDGKEGGADKRSEPKGEEQIKRIAVIARSMATVVSDAKRRRELEKLSDLTPRETVEVTETLREIALFAKVRAERKRIVVKTTGLDHQAVWVKVSAREHLETIVRNLLNNAIMYSNPGAEVVVKLRVDESKVCIDIIDNGPGLSEDEQKLIFMPGTRGQKGSSVSGGLGLGLWQSRRVAESAAGSLEVTSAGAGKGSTFTVTFPRQRDLETKRAKNTTGWALMVDDQPALTDFYARIAKALNLTPIIASSVPDAVAILQEKGEPTFILTDLHMGNTYGLDLVSFVRENFGQALPVLVVSGITDDDIEQRARKAGATDFVSKPIGRQALFARIQSLLV